jgi:hypothetical protein
MMLRAVPLIRMPCCFNCRPESAVGASGDAMVRHVYIGATAVREAYAVVLDYVRGRGLVGADHPFPHDLREWLMGLESGSQFSQTRGALQSRSGGPLAAEHGRDDQGVLRNLRSGRHWDAQNLGRSFRKHDLWHGPVHVHRLVPRLGRLVEVDGFVHLASYGRCCMAPRLVAGCRLAVLGLTCARDIRSPSSLNVLVPRGIARAYSLPRGM